MQFNETEDKNAKAAPSGGFELPEDDDEDGGMIEDSYGIDDSMKLKPPDKILTNDKVSALIITDMQNDFCEGGSMGVDDSTELIPIINKLRELVYFDFIIRCRDWHPKNHVSFHSNNPGTNLFQNVQIESTGRPQIMWPNHCVQGTQGADYHPDLVIKDSDVEILKGQL